MSSDAILSVRVWVAMAVWVIKVTVKRNLTADYELKMKVCLGDPSLHPNLLLMLCSQLLQQLVGAAALKYIYASCEEKSNQFLSFSY